MDTTVIAKHLFALGWEDVLFSTLLSSAGFIWAFHTLQGPSTKEITKTLDWKPQSNLSSHIHNSASPTSANINDLLPRTKPSAVVFWGSQGGTAEVFASRLASDLISRFSVESIIADLEDFNHVHLADIPENVPVVFVLATYGEGDPTDNACAFLDHLRDRKAKNLRLENLHFLMFGLGNSNYQHYNKVAKDVDQMLIDLGAERVGPLGMGNDSKGTTEEDFVQWKDMGVRDLAHAFGFKETASIYKPMIDILPVQGLRSLGNVYRGEPHGSYLAVPEPAAQQMANPPLILPVVNAYGVSQKDVREFVHLEFSLDDFPSIQYDTGDYLRIWPLNPEDEVSLLIRLLDLTEKRDDIISITPRAGNRQSRSNLPTPTTIESLFRHYLDICGPVSPDFLIRLSEFLPELSFKQHVEMLCRDHDRFRNEVVLQRLRLTEVLSFLSPEECSAIPLSFVIENLKKLQPRSYSISSSSLVQPRRMAVTALVLSDRMPETAPSAAAPRTFKGVTTNYLLNLKQQWCGDGRADKHLSSRYMLAGPRGMLQSSKIFAQIRPSKFKLPTAHDTPIIMIGTGSGVAPFRAFLQERAMLKERGARVGKTVLFVGHRHPDEDFLYCNEWEAARLSLGDQFKLYTAFSRCDQQPKQYVQDVLKREIEIALEILANDTRGVMYICGSSAMANCVKTCVKKEYARLVAENGGLIDADAWLQNHKHAGRLLEDSWG